MIACGLTILLICLLPSTLQWQHFWGEKYRTDWAANGSPRRIALVMEQYAQEAEQRAGEMHEMRFMYEESPHYELGYLMHEVVDKYRKMVYHVRRPMEYQTDNVFMTLKHCEQIQHLYFDIYHLVNMMHEIERKYSYLPEFANLAQEIDIQAVIDQQAQQREKERLQSRERKKRMKFYQKLETLAQLQAEKAEKGAKKRNKLWPIDYGWEVDEWW